MKIYKIIFKCRKNDTEYGHTDLWADFEEASNWYDGVLDNLDLVGIALIEMETSENCSCFDEVRVIKEHGKWWD